MFKVLRRGIFLALLNNKAFMMGAISGFVQDPDGIRGMAFQRKKKEKHALAASAV
jgi:hypothetical protein